MISQVISSQLQLHNIRKSHKVKIDEDEYEEDFEDAGGAKSEQLN
jgi:hypothetical protein